MDIYWLEGKVLSSPIKMRQNGNSGDHYIHVYQKAFRKKREAVSSAKWLRKVNKSKQSVSSLRKVFEREK